MRVLGVTLIPSLIAGAFAVAVLPGRAQAEPSGLELALRQSCGSLAEDDRLARLAGCDRFVAALDRSNPLYLLAVSKQVGLHEALEDKEGALDLLDVALTENPDAIDLREQRIQILFYTPSEYDVADDLDYLREHSPDDPRTWLYFGAYLEMFASREEAVEAYATGLALNRAHTHLLSLRATALEGMGRLDEALADRLQVIALKPEDRFAYVALAELRLARGEPEEVVAAIEAANALFYDPASDNTSFALAQAQIMLAENEAALASLDAALASPYIRENRERALAMRQDLLAKLDQPVDEAEVSTLLKAMDPNRILRIQVFFRNMGNDEVVITGTPDEATRAAYTVCMADPICNQVVGAI